MVEANGNANSITQLFDRDNVLANLETAPANATANPQYPPVQWANATTQSLIGQEEELSSGKHMDTVSTLVTVIAPDCLGKENPL